MLVFQQKRSMMLFARKNRNRSIYIVRGSNIYFSFSLSEINLYQKKNVIYHDSAKHSVFGVWPDSLSYKKY